MTTTRTRVGSVLGDVQFLHAPCHEVDDPLANIRGSISYALQVVGDPQHVGCFGDVARVRDHRRNQLLVRADVESVDVVLFNTQGPSHTHVAFAHRSQRPTYYGRYSLPHLNDPSG